MREYIALTFKQHPRLPVLLVLMVAFGVRLTYFREFRVSPYYDAPLVDAQGYDRYAWQIAQGDWLGGNEIFFQDPFYPYFLAVIYRLFGHVLQPVYVIQALLGVLTCVLVVLLAKRVFIASPYRDLIATLSGLLCALATPLLVYDYLLLKTCLKVFLTVAHLWAIISLADLSRFDVSFRRSMAFAAAFIGAGVLLGLNYLNRGNYILLIPVFFAWLFWVSWQRHGWRGSVLTLGSYILGLTLTVAPVTLRNYIVGGEWVFATSQGGANLYLGNNPDSDGMLAYPSDIRASPFTERYDFLAHAERAVGHRLSQQEMDKYYRSEVVNWFQSHPAEATALLIRKLNLWLSGLEIGDNYSFEFIKDQYSTTLKLPIATGYTFGVLGWVGLLLAMLQTKKQAALLSFSDPRQLLLGVFVIIYSLSVILFYVKSRLRAPIYPELIIFSAAALIWFADEWRQASQRMKLAVIGMVFGVGLLVWRPVWQPDWPGIRDNEIGTQYYNIGTIYLEKNQVDAALDQFERASPLLTHNFTALDNIASVYFQLGMRDRLLEFYRRKTASQPAYLSGWYNLGFLSMQHGNYSQAKAALEQYLRESGGKPSLLSADAPPPELLLGRIAVAENNMVEARRWFHQYMQQADWNSILSNPYSKEMAKALLSGEDVTDFRRGAELVLRMPDEQRKYDQLRESIGGSVWKVEAIYAVAEQLASAGVLTETQIKDLKRSGL